MNFDDETLLSAFLDDELDPADRLSVEWAIESSPPLAGRLRSLVATRDAVSGLGRPPAPVDLGPAVVARLAAARRPARPRAASRAGTLALAGGFVSLAAGLLFAMFFLHRATHDLGRPTFLAGMLESQAVSTPTPVPRPAPGPTRPEVGPPLLSRLEAPRPAVAAPVEVVGPAAPARLDAGSILRDRADRDRIAGMLGRTDVHRILIVTDVIDAGDRIKALIQKDGRKAPEFGRITVAEGIVIDPRHPGEADVFTLVLESGEYEPFLGKLARALPKAEVEVEPRPDPGLVTQLAEVGRATFLPGISSSPLDMPILLAVKDNPLNIRATRDPQTGSFVLSELDPLAPIDGFPPAQEPDGDPPRSGPTRFPATSGPTTLVVWVTRPTTRR